ncbi:MAG: hypothetical protein LC781_19990 [Actinobacteria bacterium]|nr:hypothetical protein [Actinomycetota bacterium]
MLRKDRGSTLPCSVEHIYPENLSSPSSHPYIRDEDGDDIEAGGAGVYPDTLSGQHYLQEETSSGPEVELLLILEASAQNLEFYSGHIEKEFGRNE